MREAVAEIGGDPQQTIEKLIAKAPCQRSTTIGVRRAVKVVRRYEWFWDSSKALVEYRFPAGIDPKLFKRGMTF